MHKIILCVLSVWAVCTLSAQNSPLGALPEGFPTADVTYDPITGKFSSPTFGSFRLDTDTSVKNRVVHDVLGPFVWSYNDATRQVTLNTDWYGPLTSWIPGEQPAGAPAWPYVTSVYQSSTYFVDLSGDDELKFYNHSQRRDANGNPVVDVNGNPLEVGWQTAIGIPENDAASHYQMAENFFVRMQNLFNEITRTRNTLAATAITVDADYDLIYDAININFGLFNESYDFFVFHYQLSAGAERVLTERGASIDTIQNARNWHPNLEALLSRVLQLIGNTQNVVNEAANIRESKKAEQAALIELINTPPPAPEPTPTPAPTPAPTPTPSPSPAPIIPIPTNPGVDAIDPSLIDIPGVWRQDLLNWPVSGSMDSVQFGGGGMGVFASGIENWPYSQYSFWQPPPDAGVNAVLWVVFPKGDGRYWVSVVEWYASWHGPWYQDANMYYVRDKSGISFTPVDGQQYGFFLTHASANLPGAVSNGVFAEVRTNIVLSTFRR